MHHHKKTIQTMSLISGRTAIVVSTARTGLAKSFRGKLNDTHGAALAGHAIQVNCNSLLCFSGLNVN